jgi:hypothetical protein
LAELEVDLAAAGEEDLLLLAGAEGGVDADGLGEGGAGPAFGEAEGRTIADVEPAGFAVAALGRLGAVADRGGHAREGGEAVGGGFGDEGRR